MDSYDDYIQALEEERRKIQVFERELPLCLELITRAIEACKKQLLGTTTDSFHRQYECSEHTLADGPVLEEFIPMKRNSSSSSSSEDDDDDEQESKKLKLSNSISGEDVNNNDKSSTKSDWLRSAQLWNQSTDPPTDDEPFRKVSISEVKRNGNRGAFQPFKRGQNVGTTSPGSRERSPSSVVPTSAVSSTAKSDGVKGGDGTKKEDKEGACQRKERRCWSTELHKRFLQALQQLGGAHAATPKQIRELMKVDGLTNDEVKSHLQKYRLHTRRPSPPNHSTKNNTQAPQFVVVGGLWMPPPPPDYAAMAPATTTVAPAASGVATCNGIYAPIATVPALPMVKEDQPQLEEDDRISHSVGTEVHHSNSPATSSSTHTSTASPDL